MATRDGYGSSPSGGGGGGSSSNLTPPVPGADREEVVYVRSNGSDSTGRGTHDAPWATIPRALKAYREMYDGTRLKIDVTGVNDAGSQNPSLGDGVYISGISGLPGGGTRQVYDVHIFGDYASPDAPDPLLTSPIASFNAPSTHDTQHRTTTSSFASIAGHVQDLYQDNMFQGRWFRDANGTLAVIVTHTATQAQYMGGAELVPPLQIVKPPASLLTNGNFDTPGITVDMGGSLLLEGVWLDTAYNTCLDHRRGSFRAFQSTIAEGYITLRAHGTFNDEACVFDECGLLFPVIRTVGGSFYATGSAFLGGSEYLYAGPPVRRDSCVFEGWGALGHGSIGQASPQGWAFYNSLIQNCAGVLYHGGPKCIIDTVEINNGAGDAVQARFAGGGLYLANVAGTGNVGLGLHATDGAMILLGVGNTVTGSHDAVIGTHAAEAWAAVYTAAAGTGRVDATDLTRILVSDF